MVVRTLIEHVLLLIDPYRAVGGRIGYTCQCKAFAKLFLVQRGLIRLRRIMMIGWTCEMYALNVCMKCRSDNMTMDNTWEQ